MTDTMTYTGELVVLTCWCGTVHAVPRALHDCQLRCHNDGRPMPDVYCPLGHTHAPVGPRAVDVERKRREAVEAQLVAARDQLDAERRGHASTRGQLTKARRRADRGVCQHCHRSFVDVARHVRTRHPNEVAQ